MNKKILLIGAIVIIIVAIGVSTVALGVFGQTTEIDNKFIKGTIQGIAYENNSNVTLPGWEVLYNDTENGIYYSFMMVDSIDLTKGMFTHLLGIKKLATEEYNGVKWDIYYLDPNSDTVKKYADTDVSATIDMSGYLCFASGKNGDYAVSIGSENITSDNSLNSILFKDYAEPLLKSMTLKDIKNPPKEYQFMDMTKEEYNMFKKFIKENGWEFLINQMKNSA